jgi:hypothetical protein
MRIKYKWGQVHFLKELGSNLQNTFLKINVADLKNIDKFQ